MSAQEYVVTVEAECQSWNHENENDIRDVMSHLCPGCSHTGSTIMLRFSVRASDDERACSFIRRRLNVHAAFREWRGFRVRTCMAKPLDSPDDEFD